MSVPTPHVLVMATEVVPLPGLPTVGGGLRGWILARGLEAAGLKVTLVFPREPLDALAPGLADADIAAARPYTFSWADPGAAIRQYTPTSLSAVAGIWRPNSALARYRWRSIWPGRSCSNSSTRTGRRPASSRR